MIDLKFKKNFLTKIFMEFLKMKINVIKKELKAYIWNYLMELKMKN